MTINISEIRQQLQQLASSEVAQKANYFFKEPLKTYGVKTPEVNQLAKSYSKIIRSSEKATVLAWCETLWQSGYQEEAVIACHWSRMIQKQYLPADFPLFERWIEHYVSNWASCDTFCNHTVADFVVRYPNFISELKRFTQHQNRWMKRAAAVSLILPARRGLFLNDIFEIASLLLYDGDDLVQKGYGWMLKAASEAHPQEVFNYVLARKDQMPRTALRYAIEKLPADMRAKAMEK